MNNFLFMVLIWLTVFFITCIKWDIDEEYNFPAPTIIKRIGNPLCRKKYLTMSLGLVRIFNNIFIFLSVICYFVVPTMDDYWKYFGAHYMVGIIVSFCISIITEQLCVCTRKQREDRNILGNIFVICFFSIGGLGMLFMYINLVSKGSIF